MIKAKRCARFHDVAPGRLLPHFTSAKRARAMQTPRVCRASDANVTLAALEECERRAVLVPLVAFAMSLALPSPSDAATVVNPVDVVTAVLEKASTGKVDDTVQAQSKNVVWKLPVSFPGDPLGGEFKGRYGVMTYLTRQGKLMQNIKLADLKVTPGDGRDQVVAQFRMSATVANGARFSTSVTQVWRVDPDGAIASMKAYYDTASYAKASGKAVAA